MAFILWSHDLDTGIGVIDNQHKRIVEYLNELHNANETGDMDEINPVLVPANIE